MEFEIISANYNNSQYLTRYFESIINSTLRPSKILIVDDASTDNSVEIIKSFEDKISICLIENHTNLGFANSLNLALEQVKTPFFARLDPDDFVHPERFNKQLDFFNDYPEIDIVGTNVTYILNGLKKKNSAVTLSSSKIEKFIKEGILPIIHGSIMCKSNKLIDFRYRQKFVPAEDYDLFAYSISNGLKIMNMDFSLTFVTIHRNSVSNDLKFSAVKNRFELASNYFNTNKSSLYIKFEFFHLKYYRKYLFEESILKYYFIIISALFSPFKSITKFIKVLKVFSLIF